MPRKSVLECCIIYSMICGSVSFWFGEVVWFWHESSCHPQL